MTSAGARSAARSTRMRTRARTRPILATARRLGKVTKVLELGREQARASKSYAYLLVERRAPSPGDLRNGRARRLSLHHQLRRLVKQGIQLMRPEPVRRWIMMMIGLAWCLLSATACAQPAGPSSECPQTTTGLYARLRSVELDPQRVYHIRDASIDRPNLHLDLDDGTLAFTEDICGRITGAFFEGEGEVLLRPPNRAERGSLALFTGMAILEEQFTSGYLRFNDDTAAVLKPFLSPATESADFTKQDFIKQWSDMSRTLAEFDALRLLLDFSHFLPATGQNDPNQKFPPLLHAHLQGKQLGGFDVFWDAAGVEPLWAGQPQLKDGILFFNVWTSFAPGAAGAGAPPLAGDASITSFRIRASVEPPTMLRASTEMSVRVRSGEERTLLFELS